MFFTSKQQVIVKILTSSLKGLTFVLFAFILSWFFVSKIKNISDSLHTQKRLTLILQTKQSYKNTLMEEYEQIKKHIPSIENALPKDENILDFLSAIESISKQQSVEQNLKFTGTAPAEESSPEFPINSLSFTYTANGNIFVAIETLKAFEKLPFSSKIEGFSISSPATKEGWKETSSFIIQGKLYARSTESSNSNQ
jgi:hypothetical protein